MHIIILFFLFLIGQSPLHAKEINSELNPKGAVCLIKGDNSQVLFVQSYLTMKLSLPGGYIAKGESFKDAAKRETYEETGLDVMVLEPLAIDENRVIFSCKTVSEIPYFESDLLDDLDTDVVLALKAPHYGKEVKDVYLSALSPETLKRYRYPNDADLLITLEPLVPSSPVLLSLKSKEASELQVFDKQFNIIKQLQEWFKSDSLMGLVFQAFSLLGQGVVAGALFLISALLLPRRYSLLVAFSVLLTAFSVEVLKQFFEIPRPFYLLPSLQQVTANGFSFPSGNTAQTAVILGLILGYLKELKLVNLSTALLLWCVGTLLGAVSRVWMGAHYPVDVFAGLMLGGVILLLALKLWDYDIVLIESKVVWGTLTLIYVFATWHVMQPLYVYLWFATLGIFLSTLCFKNEHNTQFNSERCIWGYSIVSLLGGGLLITPLFFLSFSVTSLLQLAIKGGITLLVIFWLFVGAPFIYQILRIKQRKP